MKIINIKTIVNGIRIYSNWFEVFNPTKKIIDAKLRNGIVLHSLDREERGAMTEIFVKEIYNKYKRINDNDIVIDIGASTGDYCIYAVKSAKNVKVFAFEQNIVKVNKALRNFRLNNVSNVEIENAFADSKKLEALVEKIGRCDFLKVDCEGCEFKIFFSLKREVFEKIKYISMECHTGSGNVTELINLLRENKYYVIAEEFMKGAMMIYAKK